MILMSDQQVPKGVEMLLVEDNPDDRELTLIALRDSGLVSGMEIATDGVEALDLLFGEGAHAGRDVSQLPRLILLDLKMPRISGLEVLKRLKAEVTTRSIPVVILTSSAEDRDLNECYALGANSYIAKPVEFGRFAEVIQSLGLYWLLLNQVPRT